MAGYRFTALLAGKRHFFRRWLPGRLAKRLSKSTDAPGVCMVSMHGHSAEQAGRPSSDRSLRRVLITGVAGFIGRYAARHFSRLGWSILGLDVVPPENTPLAHISEYHRLSLPDARLGELLRHHQPNLCIHCAGRASVGFSITDPAGDFHSGPALTFEVLNSLRLHAPNCRFIFLSSAAVYGNPKLLPVSETAPQAPISTYGFHKWQCEVLCQEFFEVYGLPTASARIFSAYGPGLRRQVVWDICRKALSREPLALTGTGKESRDFIHAGDIAMALETLAISAPMQGEVYNLASGREVTIVELAEIILHALGLERQLEFDGIVSPGTPLNWLANISKLNALGFTPRIALENGIRALAESCRAELTAF
jgi:UDP-glucose 4-epimerase